MNRYFLVISLIAMMMFSVSCVSEPKWEQLFNGKDLAGWEIYLGVPHSSVDVPDMTRNEEGLYTEPLGVGSDPLCVFAVVAEDGAPAIRVTGQIFGALATTSEYGNYHLRLETKWGEQKWEPLRTDGRRNSGLLYHGVGEYGAGLGVWKISHECQLMENDFGDSYRMGATFCDITARPNETGRGYTFDPSADKQRFGPGMPAGPICRKDPMNENPQGQWNVVELFCFEGTSVHVINGKVNMVNTNSYTLVDDKETPLTKGVIQLQSEGAEIFFRKIEISPIDKIPAEYLK